MSVDKQRNIADEQHRYLESLFLRVCNTLEELTQSPFVKKPEPQVLCEMSASLLDSTDWCLVSVWLPESRNSVLRSVDQSNGFPREENLLERIVKMVEQPETPPESSSEDKPVPLGCNALLEVGSQKERVLCIGFQQTICEKSFKYALAITGRRYYPLKSAPHTRYLSYDEYAIKPFLALCLTFLKMRVEVRHSEFLRACYNRAPEIAVETGIRLFNLKDQWGIPASAEAVRLFLDAYFTLVSQPGEVHKRAWRDELPKIRDYVQECDEYEKLSKPLDELLARIAAACLIASDLGTFAQRREWVNAFVEGGEVEWPKPLQGFG